MENINNNYYHYTSYGSMNGIVQEGLVPKIGIRSMTKYDNRGGVFLSKGIFNSIKMYASMLRYYNTYSGSNGINEINNYLNEINYLINIQNRLDENLKKQLEDEIFRLNQDIEMIKYIMSFNSFIDYLGGEGYLLSVNELDNVDEKYKEDCCYNNIIPASIINAVILRNEGNGTNIDSRELLMNYFVKTIPHDELSKIIQDEKTLDDLYKLLSKYNYVDYTGYEVQEVPLDFYNYNKQKIKPLIFN